MPYPPSNGYSNNPMFTQRHYIAVAAELHDLRRMLVRGCTHNITLTRDTYLVTDEMLSMVVRGLANMFARDNHNFKPDKFREACDYTPPVKQVSMDIDK